MHNLNRQSARMNRINDNLSRADRFPGTRIWQSPAGAIAAASISSRLPPALTSHARELTDLTRAGDRSQRTQGDKVSRKGGACMSLRQSLIKDLQWCRCRFPNF